MKSELARRISVALWGVPLALGVVYLGGWFFVAAIAVFGIIISLELQKILVGFRHPVFQLIAGTASAVGFTMIHMMGWQVIPAFLLVVVLVTSLYAVTRDVNLGYAGFIGTILPLTLVTIPFATFFVIRNSPVWGSQINGTLITLMIIGAAWIADTSAYFTGRAFGKHKLAPKVSPKKTIEGAIGGVLGGTVWSTLVGLNFLDFLKVWDWALLGVLLSIFAQVGDLTQSLVKREFGVKDSGRILPGHGGAYDRFDSVLFCGAVAYWYFLARGILSL